jgi:hypothetical protein
VSGLELGLGLGLGLGSRVGVRAEAALPLDGRLVLGRKLARRELQLLGVHTVHVHVHALLLRHRSVVGAQPGWG